MWGGVACGGLRGGGQRGDERGEGGRAVRARPRRQARGARAAAVDEGGAREQLPLVLAEEVRVEQVDEVHGVGEPVALEERSRDAVEDRGRYMGDIGEIQGRYWRRHPGCQPTRRRPLPA